MPPAHPFRFAVQSFSAQSATEWRERARAAEDLGYSALHLADHILGPGPALERTNHPLQELAAVPAIAMAAEATQRLRVGCRVFCIDYRHPAMLAKEAATLDFLSDGRLELGLGAGWLRDEYEAVGLRFDPASERIDRLTETIEVVRTLMSNDEIDFAGSHMQLHEFRGAPRPVQKPHPPLMIGGGSKRILCLAAREADIVSLNFNNRSGVIGPDGVQLSTAEQTSRKVGWIQEAAATRNTDYEIEIGAYFTFVDETADAMAEGLGDAFGLSKEEMLAHPHGLFGSVESVCDELETRRAEYGINYVTVPDTALHSFAPVVKRLHGR